MSEIQREGFALSTMEPLEVRLSGPVSATEADVDAQLFEYVSNADRHERIRSLQDLDDAWVQSMFPDLRTTADLRQRVKRELDQEYRRISASEKYAKCTEGLVARLEGELPQGYVDEHLAAAAAEYEQRLRSFGMTKAQYLAKEHLTEEEYVQRMRDDIAFKAKLDIANELLVEQWGVTVGADEVTTYLSCEDPATYVQELREGGNLEAACHAAAKVKAMRRLMDEAVVVA